MVLTKRNSNRKCLEPARNLHRKPTRKGQRCDKQSKSPTGIERLLNEKEGNLQAKRGICRAKYMSRTIRKVLKVKTTES